MSTKKKNKPLISVIIPAYNIETYIERCLESVCGQTYQNLEIIVVDDGSSDRTGEIIDILAIKDPRIIPIHKSNTGVSAARNSGLDIATGDYIGFVDGDDIIEADMYELLLTNAKKYDADISHCGYQMVFPNRVDYYYNTGKVKIQDAYQGVYDLVKADLVEPGLCNKLYKKEIIKSERLNEQIRINEDLLFNYKLFRNAKKSVFEDLPKYCYMVRKNSASTAGMNRHKLEDPLLVIKRMMQSETGEIYCLLEKRYMYQLEKISICTGVTGELKSFQIKKATELKDILKDGKLQAKYSKKEFFQLKLAAGSPFMYRMIHELYALMTGSKNKYKV